MRAAELAEKLKLVPHPEGGFYREVWRSEEVISAEALPQRFDSEHVFSTSIYYLLEQNDFSGFHRLKSDEIWFHLHGDPVLLHAVTPDGKYHKKMLGSFSEPEWQYVLRAGTCFAAEVVSAENPAGYALSGCSVSPGFDFKDFEMLSFSQMFSICSEQKDLFKKLCR